DLMLEQQAHRQPWISVACDLLQGVEGRYQDEAIQRTPTCKARSNSAPDAESDSDASARAHSLDGGIEDQWGVGNQGFGRRRTRRRTISAVMEGDDIGLRIDLVQV